MKKNLMVLLIGISFLIGACDSNNTDDTNIESNISQQVDNNLSQDENNTSQNEVPSLEKKWSSEEKLSVPESALYDEIKEVIYVSNVNNASNPWQDNNGFISTVDKNGRVVAQKWIENLKAPKGLALDGNFLYVADLDRVVKIDTNSAAVVDIFDAPTIHLNDIVYDKNTNALYVSDSSTAQILKYSFDDGSFSLFYDAEAVDPAQNGLFIKDNKLIMQGQKGYLKSIDLTTKEVTVISDKLGIRVDGIWEYEDKGFFVSDWQGKILFVQNSGDVTLLLETSPIKSADISYAPSLNLLIVPDFDKIIVTYEVQ